jgi:uncharacterized PurR-regulated membrane protein YhhQ (DUF165 family)
MTSTPAAPTTIWAPRRGITWAALATVYVAALVAANLLTSRYGLVPAGFGLTVTAGTYTAGLALAVRDSLQNTGGLRVAAGAMIIGLGLSAVTADPRIVAASVAATALGETTDLLVYTPLRRRGQRRALACSTALGAVADTLLFLTLAGFPLSPSTVGGQVLVKAVWVTGSYLLLREGVLRVVSRQRQLSRHPRGDASRGAGPDV